MMVEMAATMCSRRCHPTLVTLFSLPTLLVQRHGTKESVTGLLGQAGDDEGGRRGPLAHLSPQDQLRLSFILL